MEWKVLEDENEATGSHKGRTVFVVARWVIPKSAYVIAVKVNNGLGPVANLEPFEKSTGTREEAFAAGFARAQSFIDGSPATPGTQDMGG